MNLELKNQFILEFPPNCSKEFLENILNSLDPSRSNDFDDIIWRINSLTINFTILDSLKQKYFDWVQSFEIDLVVFSKVLLLINIKNLISSTVIRYKFDSIVKTLYFLASNNITIVNRLDFEKYLEFFLMNIVSETGIVRKLTPLSYQTFLSSINPSDWVKSLKTYQLPLIGFKDTFTKSFADTSLKNTIEVLSGGDLAYGDWKTGGSFNKLSLDYGRYYVDHCNSIFEQHINLAIAFRKTLTEAGEIVKKSGLSVNNKNLRSYVMLVIGHFLAGKKIHDFPVKTLNKHSKEWMESIEKGTRDKLRGYLITSEIFRILSSNEYLIKIAEHTQFNLESDEKSEALKQIISIRFTYLTNIRSSAICNLRSEELRCFSKLINDQTISNINAFIDAQYKLLSKKVVVDLPTPEFFLNLGIEEKSSQSKFVNNFLRFIESAGLVKFVSLTGWRESEYGFGVENLSCFPNQDILDLHTNPARYVVSWVVPKTNGETHLSREITFGAYSTALMLSELVQSGSKSPCLYSFIGNKKRPNDSKETIPRLIDNVWVNYVNNYKPFKTFEYIDELKLLENKTELNHLELIRFEYLRNLAIEENWREIDFDLGLREAKTRSASELDRVKFLIEQDNRRGFIWSYKIGELNQSQKTILDKFLSEETKTAILNFNSKKEISPVFARGIIDEIMEDCLYPTPHAFRHMWAEAVYRRFDGDVGWMIRSNFKHISAQMWLAYVRNKDNRRHHEQVKREVISSLLNNYILKNGKGFAGPLDKFLRRIIKVTHVSKPENVINFIQEFATNEIEDIKSSPWGFCLLRKRNKSNSKCADQGVPLRHNASPSLCLGCKNNLTHNGNIEGILLGISNDMKVILTPEMPECFFNESYKTVSNAFKQLKNLNAESELLAEIEACLKKGKERFSN